MSIYSRVLERSLIPAYYNLRGRSYPATRNMLEGSQWWAIDQIQEFQWRELRRLLEHAFHSVPYYRKKYALAGIELGDISCRKEFSRLPVLSRDEVNAHRFELCSESPGGRLIPHATGGSSGIPTRFFITAESYDWRCAATARAYSWSGCRIGQSSLYLWGAPVGRVSRFQKTKLDAYRFFRRERMIGTFQQTPELWEKTFHTALQVRPKYIVGYVSSLEQFARFLLSRDLRIPGIKAAIAGAEPVSQGSRDLVMEAFQAPLYDTYGSREFMSIAAECNEHDGLHIHAENLLVETEASADGGPSELLVTDLHNYGMPFIRYRIGDLGTMADSPCPCGRGLPMIRRIEGRVLEVLRTRDGRSVSPIVWRHVLKDIPEVKEFQIQQVSLDEIIVSLVLAGPLARQSETLLRQEMSKIVTPATRLTIRAVEAIPKLPSGKRRLAVGIGQPA